MAREASQIRNWIELTYSYPGMNLNSGWLAALKLDLDSITDDMGVSLVKVNRGANGRDWFDSTLKAYTLIGRMHDKIRADITKDALNYDEGIKSIIESYKKLAIIQERLLKVINEAHEKGIHNYDFIVALNSINLDDICDDDFYFNLHTKAKYVERGEWYA